MLHVLLTELLLLEVLLRTIHLHLLKVVLQGACSYRKLWFFGSVISLSGPGGLDGSCLFTRIIAEIGLLGWGVRKLFYGESVMAAGK